MSDAWELGSGLVDDFTGVVVDAFFSRDSSYNNGDTALLKLVVKADEPGTFNEDNTTTLIYTAGNDWEPREQGAKVVPTGTAKAFTRQSGIGQLISAARDLGLVDVWREKGVTPFEAGIWKGLHLEFHNKEFSATFKDGTSRQWYRMLPVATVEGPPKPEALQTSVVLDHLDPAEKGVLKAIAAAAASHDEFIEKAFTADRSWSPQVEPLLMQEDFYRALVAS